MYKLFIGFRELGEFPTIWQAKRYAQRMKQAGVFTLLGNGYRDSWYIPKIENK